MLFKNLPPSARYSCKMDYTQYSKQQVISNYAVPRHFHFHFHFHSVHFHPAAQAQQHHNKPPFEDPDVDQGHRQEYSQSGYRATYHQISTFHPIKSCQRVDHSICSCNPSKVQYEAVRSRKARRQIKSNQTYIFTPPPKPLNDRSR